MRLPVCVAISANRSAEITTLTSPKQVRVGPLSSVDDQFAWDEGGGDRSRTYWLDAHTTCFTRAYERLRLDFHPDIDVVFERFELVVPASTPGN